MPAPKATYPTPTELLAPSLFVRHWDKTPSTITWQELHAKITQDLSLKENTLKARAAKAAGDTDAYARLKSACGGITPAVQCQGGHAHKHITALTGASMVDLDHVSAEQMADALRSVCEDPHTLLCHVTTSGEGIRIFYRYTADTPEVAYLDAWRLGNEYYHMITSLAPDRACKDATRLSWLTHDPEACLNLQCKPFRVVTLEREELQYASATHVDDAVATAQSLLERSGVRYDDCRHHYMLRMAGLLHRYGVSQADTTAYLRTISPRGDREADQVAQWMYRPEHAADFGTWLMHGSRSARSILNPQPQAAPGPEDKAASPGPKPRNATREEIRRYIETHHQLRHNVILDRTEIYSPEQQAFVAADDRVLNAILHHCDATLGRYVRQADFINEVASNLVPDYNPFEDYFAHLPQWDGQDHLGQLAATVRTKDPSLQSLWEDTFRRWMVGMVSAWLDPKTMNEAILTLIGPQGIYKSSFFRNLLPPSWEPYYMVKGNGGAVNKDDRLAVTTQALINFEEVDTMRGIDLNAVKALVTTREVNERSPYARHRQVRPHTASFCATGNNTQFLTDPTGNRRWLPFEVASIRSPYDHAIPYPQLYAQAHHLATHGFRHWFTVEENEAMEQYKAHFTAPNVEAELIARYFRRPLEWETPGFYTASDVLTRLMQDVRIPLKAQAIGSALSRMGFKSHKTNGKRGYLLVQRGYDEILREPLDQGRQATQHP